MDVYLANPRGFCAGVDLAVDIVELAIKRYGSPVYVKHQIVHNPKVVADVEAMGAITVENVDEVPENSVVVFSAHGSPPSDYQIATERGLTVLDATCPLVTRVHNEAKKYSKQGKKIVLVGHVGHQEVDEAIVVEIAAVRSHGEPGGVGKLLTRHVGEGSIAIIAI